MRLKIRPPSPVGLDDPQFDWRTSLKPPPGKAAGAGIENPVRLQPIQNVIVTGKNDDLAAGATPGFRKGVSADLGNLPVDHAGEFVNDGARCAAQTSRARSARNRSPVEST